MTTNTSRKGTTHLNTTPAMQENEPDVDRPTLTLNKDKEPTEEVIPIGFTDVLSADNYVLARGDYGMWKIQNASGKGEIPEQLRGLYTDMRAANSVISCYLTTKNQQSFLDNRS